MASLDDLLTATKNIVTALNGQITTIPKSFGQTTSLTLTAPTVVVTGPGRLVNFSVVVAGAAGVIYDLSTTTVVASAAMCATPASIGVFPTGQFFTAGLLVVPGSGQSINVTYSQ